MYEMCFYKCTPDMTNVLLQMYATNVHLQMYTLHAHWTKLHHAYLWCNPHALWPLVPIYRTGTMWSHRFVSFNDIYIHTTNQLMHTHGICRSMRILGPRGQWEDRSLVLTKGASSCLMLDYMSCFVVLMVFFFLPSTAKSRPKGYSFGCWAPVVYILHKSPVWCPLWSF